MLPGCGLLLFALGAPQAAAPPTFRESVERVLIDARVLDGHGRAVPDLRKDEFRVRIDGAPADVLSVTWLSAEGARPVPGRPPADGATPLAECPRGRLLVVFVQKSLHPTRAPGLLRLLDEARRLVDRLGPDDRVAVLSFDHHLELWQDFTADPASLQRALAHDVLFEERARDVPVSPPPSLARHFDVEAGRRATTPEAALRLIGEALRPVPGSKTLVMLGYGFGEGGPGEALPADYGPARRALLRAGVAVFTLDVTEADSHTLDVGLRTVAEDTGGFFARTHDFAHEAVTRLEEALAGHYVLEVAPPRGRGYHSIDVRLAGRRGTVLARTAYFD
jgi:VWFA-related protein